MNINKEGKLDGFSRETFEILQEFDWNVEALADEIIEMRDKIATLKESNPS